MTHLTAAWTERQRLSDWLNKAPLGLPDAVFEPVSDAVFEHSRRIADTPAEGFADVLAKLRLADEGMEGERWTLNARAVRTALEWLERHIAPELREAA